MDEIRAHNWPLTGRDAELSSFERSLLDRDCKGFAIHGALGVGKSRLAGECTKRAADLGMKVMRVTATRSASDVPFGAIAHMIPSGNKATELTEVVSAISAGLSSENKRVVLLVEDLPLLDPSSRIVLHRLLDADLIFLVSTARTASTDSAASAVSLQQYPLARTYLEDTDQATVHRLLEAALGGSVSRRTSYELHLKSGGNHLFLRELVRAAVESNSLKNDGEVWEISRDGAFSAATPELTDLILSRLSAIPAEDRSLIEVLAICGETSTNVSPSSQEEETLIRLENEGLAEVSLDGQRVAVTLAHPLYGEVIQKNMPLFRRRQILLGQVAAMEAFGLRRRDDFFKSALWRVEATGSADKQTLYRAARMARDAHDYEQSLKLLEAVPERERDIAFLLLWGDSLVQASQISKAEEVLVQAQSLASNEEELLDVVFARVQNLFWSEGRKDEALAVIKEAKKNVVTPSGTYKILSSEATILVACGQPAAGLEAIESMAHQPPGPKEVNAWLITLAFTSPALTMTGRTEEAIDAAEQAYETNLKYNDQALYLHPATQLNSLILALSESGRLERARTVGLGALEQVLEARAAIATVWAAMHLARVEWLSGHPGPARHWYAEAAALARTHHQGLAMRWALCGLAAAAAQLGDTDGARKAIAEAERYPDVGLFVGENMSATAWLNVADGDLVAARRVLTAAAREARDAGVRNTEVALLVDIARLGDARGVTSRLTELAACCDGAFTAARVRYVKALAADDPAEMMACATEFEGLGADLLAAESAATAAAAWRRMGETRKATAAANQSAALAPRCGGARTPALDTAIEPAAALTSREREIAILTATGASAQDVAESLSISRRTVQNHLYNIYGKLGVSNRSELKKTLNGNG